MFIFIFQATKTKAVIGEREGKVDNKTKIELIREEVEKIKEEKKEEEEEAKVDVTYCLCLYLVSILQKLSTK